MGIIISVIVLKKRFCEIIKNLVICILFGAIAFSAGYIYLDRKLKSRISFDANQITESVPYYHTPENKGLLFDICGEKTLVYLDFSLECINIVHPTEGENSEINTFGFPVDFTLNADYSFVGLIVDIVGGIDLTTENGTYRFTGVQITDMLTYTPLGNDVKYHITQAIFEKISEKGFSREDFLSLIKGCHTNLTIPDCYYWSDYSIKLSKSMRIIN